MPIWLNNLRASSEDLEFHKVHEKTSQTLRKGNQRKVDKEVGSDGLKITYKDGRIMHITDSDYKLKFYDSATRRQVVLQIINTWFQGAASFDVERKNGCFIIQNNDMRLYHADDVDGPYENYCIYSNTDGGKLAWHCEGFDN